MAAVSPSEPPKVIADITVSAVRPTRCSFWNSTVSLEYGLRVNSGREVVKISAPFSSRSVAWRCPSLLVVKSTVDLLLALATNAIRRLRSSSPSISIACPAWLCIVSRSAVTFH